MHCTAQKTLGNLGFEAVSAVSSVKVQSLWCPACHMPLLSSAPTTTDPTLRSLVSPTLIIYLHFANLFPLYYLDLILGLIVSSLGTPLPAKGPKHIQPSQERVKVLDSGPGTLLLPYLTDTPAHSTFLTFLRSSNPNTPFTSIFSFSHHLSSLSFRGSTESSSIPNLPTQLYLRLPKLCRSRLLPQSVSQAGSKPSKESTRPSSSSYRKALSRDLSTRILIPSLHLNHDPLASPHYSLNSRQPYFSFVAHL
ncbi:uncharacterized protein CLUP02_06231 [Colletotrichum lupini]|uniref:Uncharacterized protein n=1 Tax=Colletotrichum lupini TaxID=145971 RepID=A0A9Q8SNS6_9PEZI|nr:uncharacterized protein CLUP02_06231 [Colletotrichum lupini]UQC80746.1 hypothetical protein CLUP02_06231 [Colletotrichum lupini]